MGFKKKMLKGNASRPRISVFRSNRFFYAQVIDDTIGSTICAESSLKYEKGNLSAIAKQVASNLSIKIKDIDATSFLFDCGNYQYKGSIKVFAESLRDNGVKC